MSKTSGYASINGINMYYEIHGEGFMPLVLIHGGGSTIESSFGEILPLFSVFTKVIALELQAHGRTSDRDAPESFEQDADDVAALIKYLKIEKSNFLGFSNGGTTTLQIAIRHPELVNKIIVISSNYKKEGMIQGLFDGLKNATLDDMPSALKEAYLKVAPDKDGLHVMFEKDRDRMLGFKDMADEDLKSIKADTLLMASDKDVVIVEHVVKMSQLIPKSKLVILPGVHGSIIGEVGANKKGSNLPKITASIVEEFING